jgi:hypothetical protein
MSTNYLSNRNYTGKRKADTEEDDGDRKKKPQVSTKKIGKNGNNEEEQDDDKKDEKEEVESESELVVLAQKQPTACNCKSSFRKLRKKISFLQGRISELVTEFRQEFHYLWDRKKKQLKKPVRW